MTPTTPPPPGIDADAPAAGVLTTAPRLSLLVALLLTGLSAGFFFTYEASVTVALAEVDDRTYVATFQAINDTIKNPAFGVVFFGAIPALVATVALHWRSPATTRRLLGAALGLYLVCVAITAAGNIPLNDQLGEQRDLDQAAEARAEFESDWNQLNLLRTGAVIASFVSLAAASTLTRRTARTPSPAP